MTEIALRPDTAPAVIEGMNPTIASLTEWAHSARAAHGIATSLVETSFVPEAFRGKPAEATAAILAGAEVGLSPMAALRSFDIIQGTAAPRANTLRAVVQAQGHDVWVVESTDTRAKVSGQRRGSSQVQTSTWTIDRAKRLGLVGKQNWQKQPQAMLVARATAECCRLVASDAILGLPYALEEIADGGYTPDGAATLEDDAPTPKRTARRAPLAPVPEPPLDDPADLIPPDPPPNDERFTPDEPATRPQITKLNIQLQEAGYDDREEKLRFLTLKTGRPITSSNDLTKAEAHTLIEEFETGTAAEPPLDEPA